VVSLDIRDLVYEAKAKTFLKAKAKDLHEVFSRILEAKARPRGQQDCVWCSLCSAVAEGETRTNLSPIEAARTVLLQQTEGCLI